MTTGGRTFTVIYALFGIPLALVVYGKVGFWLDRSLARLIQRFTRHKHLSKREKIARSVVNLFGGTFLFMLVPPIGFMRRENWSYGEGVYYSFITLTTIGLGDLVAGATFCYYCFICTATCACTLEFMIRRAAGFDETHDAWYLIWTSVWIVLGLVWMSSLVSNLFDIFNETMSKMLVEDSDGPVAKEEKDSKSAASTSSKDQDTKSSPKLESRSPKLCKDSKT